MKIGLVTDFYFPWIGGPAILVRSLAEGLSARGHAVSILAPSATGRTSVAWEGAVRVTRARTVHSPVGYGLRVSRRPLSDAREWLDREQPDAVHVHHPFPLSAATLLAARRRGIPVAATNHTIPECSLWGVRAVPVIYPVTSGAFGQWITWLLGSCDSVSTPTATAAYYLRALGWKREITIISNGIDTRRFTPGAPQSDLRQRLGLDDRPIVLYTGRLDAEKQVDIVLTASTLLPNDVPHQLVIGGQGADRARLESLSRELGLSGRVRFIGYVSDADLPDLYRLAHIYFMPSSVELQSITTLEAVTSGLPVVAANAGALPELVRDGVNGALFPVGDASAAATALDRFLRDETLRVRAGGESRKVGEEHALERTIEEYEGFLQGTLQTRGRGKRRERLTASG